MKKVFNVLCTVLLVALICVVLMIFYARLSGNIPEILGYQIFRVSSGSMSPTLEVGDVILSRRVDIDEIHRGDIITYHGEEGDFRGRLITHMVIEEPKKNENGIYILQTQGTAEGTTPDPPIEGRQVIGRYVSSLLFLNALYTFFVSPMGLITFIIIIVVLFGYELISLIFSYKSFEGSEDGSSGSKDGSSGKSKKNRLFKGKAKKSKKD